MIRKILMVAIAVFASYDIQIQSLCATLLVVFVLCIHSLSCPYINESLDGLELLSLFGSFSTYFFGQFLFAEAVGKTGKAFVSFIIVMVNFSVMLAVGLMVVGKSVPMVSAFGRKYRKFIGKYFPSVTKNQKDDGVEDECDTDVVGNVAEQPKRKQLTVNVDEESSLSAFGRKVIAAICCEKRMEQTPGQVQWTLFETFSFREKL